MAPHTAANIVPDHTVVLKPDGTPIWNGDPMYLALYLNQLILALPGGTKGSRTFITKGYTVGRKVNAFSSEHADLINTNTLPVHSMGMAARVAGALEAVSVLVTALLRRWGGSVAVVLGAW